MRQSAALLLFCLASAEISIQATSPGFVDFDRRAKAGERLNVVFFGGSLTWGANASDPQISSWRAVVAQRLEVEYPKGRFKFWDASLGGAGALVGVFRLERDVLRRKPDLVFIDFAVADGIADLNPEEIAAHEAIVSRIVQSGHAAVVQLVLPYKRDVMRGNTDGMKGRDVVIDTARRYHLGLGDAMVLCQEFVKVGRVTAAQLWPFESNFPGDKAHDLFADAAWRAFMEAIQSKRVCSLPPKIRYADTYMTTARVRFSSLGPAPAGWRVGLPNPIGASFDMSMSRWLDDEVIASNKREITRKDKSKQTVTTNTAPLRVRFNGSIIMLLGESTPKSVNYRAYLDGKLVEHKGSDDKEVVYEFDAGASGKALKGNTYHFQTIADGLDITKDHILEIYPIFFGDAEQELRLESICVAGGKAAVYPVAQ